MSKKIMSLLSIVQEGTGQKLIKELKALNIRLNFQTVGHGTAPTEMMDIFGLGSNDKDIVISLGAENDIRDMVANFDKNFQSHASYGGLMIVFDIAASSRLLNEILNFGNQNTEKEFAPMKNEHSSNLIVISVNEGYSENVMHVARKAGATGGTIIKGRLADIEEFADFVQTEVDGDREILFILTPTKVGDRIMEDVNREFGFTSEANGIIFAVPTERAFKI